MIFESHVHYDDKQYDLDREELLEKLVRQNVGTIINVGASIESSMESIALAQVHPFVYASVGVHPDETACLEEEGIAPLREMVKEPKVVAVGEIGLDYFRKEGTDYKSIQQKWFKRQLQLAAEEKKPAIIHSRDAAEDTMAILQEYRKTFPEIENPGVVHCYSYSPELALSYISMGFYIGVGGVVTFKNAKKLVETVRRIPLERILVETDSPYLSPEPYRGQRNHSANISFVIDKIAEIKGLSSREVEIQTEKNGRTMYGI